MSDPIDPTQKHKFPFPDPRRVRSHRFDSPVQFMSRVKFLSRVNFLSSSRIHDESDPIDLTQKHKFQFTDPRRVRSHRSDSPVQFLSRSRSSSSSSSKDPSPFQIQPYESDPFNPTQFYFSVYGSRFQTGPRLMASVGGSIPGSEIHQCGVHNNKFRSEVRAGSS